MCGIICNKNHWQGFFAAVHVIWITALFPAEGRSFNLIHMIKQQNAGKALIKCDYTWEGISLSTWVKSRDIFSASTVLVVPSLLTSVLCLYGQPSPFTQSSGRQTAVINAIHKKTGSKTLEILTGDIPRDRGRVEPVASVSSDRCSRCEGGTRC